VRTVRAVRSRRLFDAPPIFSRDEKISAVQLPFRELHATHIAFSSLVAPPLATGVVWCMETRVMGDPQSGQGWPLAVSRADSVAVRQGLPNLR
jgi:hypothetical protein